MAGVPGGRNRQAGPQATYHAEQGYETRHAARCAPISPLLANLYMRRFVLGWKTLGYQKRFRARIVNYADDFVILCRSRAEDAATAMRGMMERLKLTVNETKTHVCRLPAESFDFLGYTFGRMYSPRTGGAYIGAKPSHKKVLGVCRQLNELVGKIPTFIRPEAMVYRVNQVLRGWAGYFGYGTYSPAFCPSTSTLPTGSVGGYVGSSTLKVKGTANSRTAIWSESSDC